MFLELVFCVGRKRVIKMNEKTSAMLSGPLCCRDSIEQEDGMYSGVWDTCCLSASVLL